MDHSHLVRALAKAGRTNHGLVGGAARDDDVSRSQLHRLTTTGHLEVVHRGVHRHAGSPRSERQLLLAAVMAGGPQAAASHRSAAALWGLRSAPPQPEIVVPFAGYRRIRGTTVHRSRDLRPEQIVSVDRIPVTNPMVTLVDLGAVVSPRQVENALDRALVAKLVTASAVEAVVAELGRPGRRGAGVIRRILDERALGADRPESLLEARFASLLRRYELPAAIFQHPVEVGGRTVARIDFAYPTLRLGIEVDGFDVHSSPRALQRDLDRQNQLVMLGWTVLRFTWADVVRRPAMVAGHVAEALERGSAAATRRR